MILLANNFEKIPRFLFKRSLVLYVVIGLIFYFSIDRQYLQYERLNYLKDRDGYLERFANGEVPFNEEKLRHAKNYFKESIKILPFRSLAYADLGFCYFYLNEIPKSLDAYRKAIAGDPNWYSFYFDLGLICLKAGASHTAVDFFEESLKLLPQNQAAFKQMAEVYAQSGQNGLAEELLACSREAQRDQRNDKRRCPLQGFHHLPLRLGSTPTEWSHLLAERHKSCPNTKGASNVWSLIRTQELHILSESSKAYLQIPCLRV